MKLIALYNKGVNKEIAEKAIAKLAKDYDETGVNFSYDVEEVDLPMEFVKYNPRMYSGSFGLDFYIISKEAKRIRMKYSNKYDLITIFISKEDWVMGSERVSGWNMGEFFSGFQIQQVRVSTERSTYFILAQEIMHSFDQFIKLELGINISELFNVKNFDQDIVHRYQFEYIPYYKKLALLLNRTFEIRNRRYVLNQSQFKLIELLKMLIQELRIKIINTKKNARKVVL